MEDSDSDTESSVPGASVPAAGVRGAGVPEALESAVARALAGVLPRGAVTPRTDERPHPRLRLRPLPGGIARRSYVATAGDKAWAVRVSSAPPVGALDIGAEAEVARRAALVGVAPPLVAVDAAGGLLITEYHADAVTLSQEDVRRPDNIPRIADLLRSLHKIRGIVRGFDPERFAVDYVQALGGLHALSGKERRLAEEFATLAREYRLRYPSIVLCHNDLVASNLLDDGRLWLIDFEYAVTAAPVLDLAGLAGLNDFGSYERWQLAEAYYEGAPVPFTANEFDKVVRLVRLMAYFWALSSARLEADPEPFSHFVDRVAAVLK